MSRPDTLIMSKIIIVATVLLSSINVFADEAKPADPAPQPSAAPTYPRESYASALLGAAIGTSSGGSTSFIFSGRVGTGILADRSGILSLGLVAGHTSASRSVGTVTVDGSTTLILAELISRKLFETGLYLGGRFGIGLENVDLKSGAADLSSSSTAFAVGPALGYEFPIIPQLAFDFDFSWITVFGSTFTFPGAGSIQTNSSGAALLQGGLTYHW